MRDRVAQVAERQLADLDRAVEQLVDQLLLGDPLGQVAGVERDRIERGVDPGAQHDPHVAIGALAEVAQHGGDPLVIGPRSELVLGELARGGVEVLGDPDLAGRRQRADQRAPSARQQPAGDVDRLDVALGDHARGLQIGEQPHARGEPQHALGGDRLGDRQQRRGPAGLRRRAADRARQPLAQRLQIVSRGVAIAGPQRQDRGPRAVALVAGPAGPLARRAIDHGDHAGGARGGGPGGGLGAAAMPGRRLVDDRLPGRARRPGRREQRRRIDVERDRGVDPRDLESRERAAERARGKRAELEVERDELDVRGGVAGRRQQPVVLAQHGADLVELGLADPVDPLADRRRGDRAGPGQRVERLVDPGMEDRAPRPRQLGGIAGRQRAARPAEDHDVVGQRLGIDAELAAVDQALQVGARQRVAPGVRHLEPDPGQLAVLLDHAANDAVLQEDRRHAREVGVELVHRLVK